jgi:hypothetical protein
MGCECAPLVVKYGNIRQRSIKKLSFSETVFVIRFGIGSVKPPRNRHAAAEIGRGAIAMKKLKPDTGAPIEKQNLRLQRERPARPSQCEFRGSQEPRCYFVNLEGDPIGHARTRKLCHAAEPGIDIAKDGVVQHSGRKHKV